MYPGHLWWVSDSGGARDIWGKTALYGSRARAKELAAFVLLSGSAPEQTTERPHLICVEPSPRTLNSEAALAQRYWPTTTKLKIAQASPWPENHSALPLCGATHSAQASDRGYHCACISGKSYWQITTASMNYCMAWRITGISGPITDGNWSCCDLCLLQEPMDSELATNLMLYQPDGPTSP